PPEELLFWRTPVVKQSGSLIKATRVRGGLKTEKLEIKLMAKLVAQRAQESAKRGDLLAHRGPHPDTNNVFLRFIIPKKLGAPTAFIEAEGPRRKYPHGRRGN